MKSSFSYYNRNNFSSYSNSNNLSESNIITIPSYYSKKNIIDKKITIPISPNDKNQNIFFKKINLNKIKNNNSFNKGHQFNIKRYFHSIGNSYPKNYLNCGSKEKIYNYNNRYQNSLSRKKENIIKNDEYFEMKRSFEKLSNEINDLNQFIKSKDASKQKNNLNIDINNSNINNYNENNTYIKNNNIFSFNKKNFNINKENKNLYNRSLIYNNNRTSNIFDLNLSNKILNSSLTSNINPLSPSYNFNKYNLNENKEK